MLTRSWIWQAENGHTPDLLLAGANGPVAFWLEDMALRSVFTNGQCQLEAGANPNPCHLSRQPIQSSRASRSN